MRTQRMLQLSDAHGMQRYHEAVLLLPVAGQGVVPFRPQRVHCSVASALQVGQVIPMWWVEIGERAAPDRVGGTCSAIPLLETTVDSGFAGMVAYRTPTYTPTSDGARALRCATILLARSFTLVLYLRAGSLTLIGTLDARDSLGIGGTLFA